MKTMIRRTVLVVSFVFALCTVCAAQAQYRYDGYSLIVEADESGVCPVRYLPANVNNPPTYDLQITVTYLNAAGQTINATGLTACDGSGILANGYQVQPNGLGRWCFTGPQPNYDITFATLTPDKYRWLPNNNATGFYNVKDFIRERDAQGNPIPPADWTKVIKNAVAYIAARQGGTLYFPEGDYLVGTNGSGGVDANYKGIALPSGINIQGASGNPSFPTTNLPWNKSASRIRVKFANQKVLRIGGCTERITVRNIELMAERNGNALQTGTVGIEALGKYVSNIDARSTQNVLFENITFTDFDKGIYAHALDTVCSPPAYLCYVWQFDYVKLSHCSFNYANIAVHVDTGNTDWQIDSTLFFQPPGGHGLYIRRGGAFLVQNTFAGGIDYGPAQGGDFIHAVVNGPINIINCAVERSTRSLYTDPSGGDYSYPITVVNSVMGDKIFLNGRRTYVSTGNLYGPRTVNATSDVRIYSTGDRFCYDGYIQGKCRGRNDQGQVVEYDDGGFQGGNIIFETGQPAERATSHGQTVDIIAPRPSKFGFDVVMRANDELATANPTSPLLSLFSPPTFSAAPDKPLLRIGDPNAYYDMQRSNWGILTFKAGPTASGINPYQGYSFDKPVKLPTYTFEQLYDVNMQGYFTSLGVGAMIFCTNCTRQAPGAACTGGGGGTIAVANIFSGSFFWQCQ